MRGWRGNDVFAASGAIPRIEIIHIRRDPATRFVFALPIIELLIFGYAIDTDVKNIPTVVFDLNGQSESRALIKEFESTRYFRFVGQFTPTMSCSGLL